jgi:hypothetical protein
MENLGLPILLQDERWSTQAVTRTPIEQDISRAKRAECVDKMAAAYILQGAIDSVTSRLPYAEGATLCLKRFSPTPKRGGPTLPD